MTRLEHGTPEGYDRGCTTDTDCPAFTIHGMSCETAHYRHVSGERRYEMLRGRGLTSTQIAQRLGFIPSHGTPTPKETPAMTTTPAPKPAPPRKPLSVTPVIETPLTAAETEATGQASPAPELLTTDKWTTGLTAYAKTQRLRGIRQWCRDHGFPGVPVKGRIPQDALEAYDAAHQAGEIDIDAAAAEIVAEGLAEHGLADEMRPDFEHLANDFTDALDEARDRATDNDAIDMLHAAIAKDVSERLDAALEAQDGGDDEAVIVGLVDLDNPEVVERMVDWDLAIALAGTMDGTQMAAASVDEDGTARIELLEHVAANEWQNLTSDGTLTDAQVAQRYDDVVVTFLPQKVTPTAEVDTEAAQVDTETPKSDTQRPEWAAVAISEDVERARSLTARIWGEAAQLEEQLHQAHQERDAAQRSMILALRQWADGRAQLEAERTEHAYVLAQLDHELWATNQALIAARAAKYAIANLRRITTSRDRRAQRGTR